MDRCLILGGGLSGRAAARLAADIGMKPKIENALAAVDAGVSRVIITRADAIDGRSGTVVTR